MIDALEFDGPAIVCCYTTCQPEHGVADNMATDQARLAVDTRAFPLLIYDPRKGDTIRERLTLQGNPAVKEDWWTNPKTGQIVDFVDFARSEGRFAKHFDKEGNPSPTLLRGQAKIGWRTGTCLQELAGVRGTDKPATKPPAKSEAKPAAAAGKPLPGKVAARAAGNGHSTPAPKNGDAPSPMNGDFSVGTRIKYHDGAEWIRASSNCVEPAVIKLDDESEIRTSYEVVLAGAAEGLIVRQ